MHCLSMPSPSKAGASACVGISERRRIETAAMKFFVGFYKKGSRPFSYALLLFVFIRGHAFAALRFVTFSSRKK